MSSNETRTENVETRQAAATETASAEDRQRDDPQADDRHPSAPPSNGTADADAADADAAAPAVPASRPREREAETPEVAALHSADPSETVPEPTEEDRPTPDESPAAAVDAEEPALPDPASPAAERRVWLKPIVREEQARAVPSIAAPSAPPPQAGPATEPPRPSAPPPPPPPPPSGPVDVPRIDELDADLAAEIDAAMVGEQQTAIPTAAAAETSAEAPPVLDEEALEPGTRLTGRIQSVDGDNVFLDVGYRSPGVVSRRQFEAGKEPQAGQLIEVVVEKVHREDGLIVLNLPRGMRKISGNWEAVEVGQTVDCTVNKTNKGGLEVTISNIRGFLPASQVDLRYVDDLEQYIGQKLRVKITEANRQKRNLIVSRRAYLLEEREEKEQEIWGALAPGQTFTGTVKTIKNYGAFVDIGGVDGFLHVGEIAWTRIRHPGDLLKEGQEVEVQVLKIDPEKKKISLGMRQLKPNPWADAENRYPVGSTASGQVTRTTD
ncbi:MAG: S1 RNA-binding domain-containing protein, partial [Planctomycetaceae bacterium]